MAATDETGDRRVVPRWKSFHDALKSGELNGATTNKGKSVDGKEFIREREKAYNDNQTLAFAVDLVGASIVLGQSDVAPRAAEFILANSGSVSPSAVTLAEKILGIEEQVPDVKCTTANSPQRQIVKLKMRRIEEERNAFVWLDLARNYMLLGQSKSASEAIQVARALAPYDRFIIRSMVRFLLHSRKPEEAIHLLRSNPKTPYDPWLVASETAISSVLAIEPKFLKIGLNLIRDSNFSSFHTSELASALGSFEMFAGNNKAANKMFRMALRDPNDNALAQIVWSSKKTGFIEVAEKALAIPNAAEATALDHHNNGRWSEVIVQSKAWTDEEAFSSRPRLLASGVSSALLNDPKTGKEIAEAGLATNPGHPGLLNNIAFSEALLGRPDAALKAIERVDRKLITPTDAICLLATLGLANFRAGNVADGIENYEASIAAAKRTGKLGLQTLARLYFARELHLKHDPRGLSMFQDAHQTAQKLKTTTIPAVADVILKTFSQSVD